MKGTTHEPTGDWRDDRESALQQLVTERRRRQLEPKTTNQGLYLEAMRRAAITICLGPAGTGKTWLACGLASQMLEDNKVERIVLVRPQVPCGKGVGFLKGSLEEKIAPWMRPVLDALEDFMGPTTLRRKLEVGDIEMEAPDLIRGASLRRSFIIVDEAQNLTMQQWHMLLTRIGENSKMVLVGDISKTQIDLQVGGDVPMMTVLERIARRGGHPDVAVVKLARKDIVRHPLIQWLDETISGDEVEGEWTSFRCPHCKARLYYEDGIGGPAIAQCCRCTKTIQLFDEEGRLAPATSTSRKGPFAPTYPEPL
jgi:phosphate starvation-inducible PhoH-like protein